MPSRPLPDKVLVSTRPLVELINALNGAPHQIRELQVTRGDLFDNPIDALYKEVMEYQNDPAPVDPHLSLSGAPSATMVDQMCEGTLFNHKRAGAPSVESVLGIIDQYASFDRKGRDEAEAALRSLFGGQ
jgi:hypothetical protein